MTDVLNAIVLLGNFVLVPGLAYGSQLALGALGVTLIYGILRFSNLAHGETMSFGAMIASLIAEAPQAIKALVMASALFCANVGVIGVGAFMIGASADWMAASNVAAPMTRALLGADTLLIPAIVVYLLLHPAFSTRVEG